MTKSLAVAMATPGDAGPTYTFAGEREPRPDLMGMGETEQKPFSLAAFSSRDIQKSSSPLTNEQHPKKPKPWQNRRRSQAAGGAGVKIRVKLPTIESYDREVVCSPDASPKVMVRLERVTGSDRVRIKNTKYLNMLSKRIIDEEELLLGGLHKRRRDEELRRYRDLAIAGEIEAEEGMEEVTSHPLYRVNRIMKRINAMQFNPTDTLNVRKTKPKITPTEPFAVYEKTGMLFGFHPDHYSKKDLSTPPPLERTGSLASSKWSTVIRPMTAPAAPLGQVADDEEWGGEGGYGEEGLMPEEELGRMSFTTESAADLGHLLRRSSMSLARRYLGLDPNDKQFQLQRSRVVEEFLSSEDPGSQRMYEFAKGISGAMQRTQARGEDFCNKTHRKLFV